MSSSTSAMLRKQNNVRLKLLLNKLQLKQCFYPFTNHFFHKCDITQTKDAYDASEADADARRRQQEGVDGAEDQVRGRILVGYVSQNVESR
jgi:hypothetical protein